MKSLAMVDLALRTSHGELAKITPTIVNDTGGLRAALSIQSQLRQDGRLVMSKSTPGPWMPFATPESSNQAWVVKAGRKRVAAVYCNNPIDRLDARLIAAAPELLEACKIAVELCPCNLRERESGHKLGCYAPMMLAAIQKAEGGE